MPTPALFLLVPLLGVTFGYEPSPDSAVGYDYTVQIEPEMLDRLQQEGAEAIEANLPPEVNPIRRIRVVVGRDSLPKKLRRPSLSADSRPVKRATFRPDTFRPDIDATGRPDIGLLAQTGPAGGFGRSSLGFSGTTPTRTTPTRTTGVQPYTPPPATATIPPIGTRPYTPAPANLRPLTAHPHPHPQVTPFAGVPQPSQDPRLATPAGNGGVNDARFATPVAAPVPGNPAMGTARDAAGSRALPVQGRRNLVDNSGQRYYSNATPTETSNWDNRGYNNQSGATDSSPTPEYSVPEHATSIWPAQ